MPHRPEGMAGMERLVRHDGESRDTDRLTWSHHRRPSGGQGARREAGSERLEEGRHQREQSRQMNRSAKDGEWSISGQRHPPRRTKVCAGDTVGKSVK